MQVNLRSFKQKVRHNKKAFSKYLGAIAKNPPKGLDNNVSKIDEQVWQEIDCLSCANCCKTMSPTFTKKDVKRISEHLQMSTKEFTEKWLVYEEEDKDWVNKKQPCQFLSKETNMCSIYVVRPSDCAGFPHLKKRKMPEYMHWHQQNISYCPATYKMVEKMMENGIKPEKKSK